jgi:hypothetical protein
MQRFFSSKLYYREFPYKISFLRSGPIDINVWGTGWTPLKCSKWMDQKKWPYRHKIKISVQKKIKQVSVKGYFYLKTREAYDSCIKKYKRYITSITAPHSDSHIELLNNNSNMIIRETLLYKKFRYVINFRRTWHTPIDDIDDWVRNNYKTAIYDGDVKWVALGYNPRLYVTNDEDLVLVKLTWGERIREITHIQLLNEL